MTTAPAAAGPNAPYLTPIDVARRFVVSDDAVRQWASVGLRVNGRTVKLGCVRVGVQYRFSEDHLKEFTEACEAANRGDPVVIPRGPTAAELNDEQREAMAALDAM